MKYLIITICILSLFITNLLGQQKDTVYFAKLKEAETKIIKLNEGYSLFSQSFGTGKIKILFLNGGPGNTFEAFDIFKSQLPLDKFQLIFYDQLGGYFSDIPKDTTVWNIPRFVDEVEQVRKFYNLDKFYLLGHSWGGLLAMEYELKYRSNLKGIIVSNKSYSQKNLIDTRYERLTKIAIDSNCSAQTIQELKNHELYSDTLDADKIEPAFYRNYTLRLDSIPIPMKTSARHVTIGKFVKYFKDRQVWDISPRLSQIKTPTLIIGGASDFVRVSDLKYMHKKIKKSTLFICPNGGHFSFWDDSINYFKGLKKFIDKTENSR